MPNGLTLIICERPEAPVFSFFTLVDAGSAQDPMGATGLAHMFEHMAFKGTDKIGTTDYAAEKPALEKVEAAYAAYIAERDKTVGRDEAKLKQLEKAWKDAIAEADKFVVPNAFGKLVEQNGGEDMNASTSYDQTEYHYSLPENRLELWAYLESERFLHPVMREFYKERNVVIEERRMRTDSNPVRPPARAVHRSGLRSPSLSPPDRRMDGRSEFISPPPTRRNSSTNTTCRRTWWSLSPATSKPLRPCPSSKNISAACRRARSPTKPPRPSLRKTPNAKSCSKIARSRFTSRAITVPTTAAKTMPSSTPSPISCRKAAPRASTARWSATRKSPPSPRDSPACPASSIPTCSRFYAVPLPGHTTQEMADAIHAEIDKLKKEDITDDELKMIKTRSKANLIRGLADNEGLATQLATYQTRYGDWRELFKSVDRIDQVTKADIRRVANEVFVDTNRTVGVIENAGGAPVRRVILRRRSTRAAPSTRLREVRNENAHERSSPSRL